MHWLVLLGYNQLILNRRKGVIIKIYSVISTNSTPAKTSRSLVSKCSSCAVTTQSPNFTAQPPKSKNIFVRLVRNIWEDIEKNIERTREENENMTAEEYWEKRIEQKIADDAS